MLMGCYYVPHVAISFVTLGLCMGFMKDGKKQEILKSVFGDENIEILNK